MKMFYTYRQNNSGGRFIGYKYVIIEAENAERANEIAQDNDVYFNGCSAGLDCSCCGDRWYPAFEGDCSEEPMIYGDPAKEFSDTFHEPGEFLKIVYLSGEVFTSNK
jgi:hypothetical protein